jgi:hypothetical protein
MIYLAILVILITEAAKVREHLWAGVTHEHWAKRPIWPRLPASDAFHVASALSHYPIILALLWATESPWWVYIIVAILSQVIWWQAKVIKGRDWPNKLEQLYNWGRTTYER